MCELNGRKYNSISFMHQIFSAILKWKLYQIAQLVLPVLKSVVHRNVLLKVLSAFIIFAVICELWAISWHEWRVFDAKFLYMVFIFILMWIYWCKIYIVNTSFWGMALLSLAYFSSYSVEILPCCWFLFLVKYHNKFCMRQTRKLIMKQYSGICEDIFNLCALQRVNA